MLRWQRESFFLRCNVTVCNLYWYYCFLTHISYHTYADDLEIYSQAALSSFQRNLPYEGVVRFNQSDDIMCTYHLSFTYVIKKNGNKLIFEIGNLKS